MLGWYSGDEHLHQQPDAATMLAEDLNVVAMPGCNDALRRYQAGQKTTPLPDATHLLVTLVPAIEWDCFLWNLPKPLALRLGDEDWPDRDAAAAAGQEIPTRPGDRYPLHQPILVRRPFILEQAHAAGAMPVAYMHELPRALYCKEIKTLQYKVIWNPAIRADGRLRGPIRRPGRASTT